MLMQGAIYRQPAHAGVKHSKLAVDLARRYSRGPIRSAMIEFRLQAFDEKLPHQGPGIRGTGVSPAAPH